MRDRSVKRLTARAAAVGGVCAVALAAVGSASAAAPPINLKKLGVKVPKKFIPFAEAVAPNGKTLYVTGEGGTYVFNLAKPKSAPKKVTVSGTPVEAIALTLSPSGKSLYLAAEGSGSSSSLAIDVAKVGGSGVTNNTVVGTVADPHKYLGSSDALPLEGMAVSHNGKILYVTTLHEGSSSSSVNGGIAMAKVTATGGTLNKIYDPKNTLGYAAGMALNPKGDRIYVSNLFGASSVLKVSGEKISSPHLLPEVLSSGGLAVSHNGATLYDTVFSFAILEGDLGASNSEVQAFGLSDGGDKATLQQAKILPNHADAFGLALSPSGKTGFVAPFTITGSGSSETFHASIDTFATASKKKK
jgi:hypothetical protein